MASELVHRLQTELDSTKADLCVSLLDGWVELSQGQQGRSVGFFVEGDRHSEACRVIVGVGAVIQHQPFAWNDVFVMWPFGLLAHEVHYALGLFVQETGESTWAERLSACQLQANTLMPPRERWGSTVSYLAPPRPVTRA